MNYQYIQSPSRRKQRPAIRASELGLGLFLGVVAIVVYAQLMMAVFN